VIPGPHFAALARAHLAAGRTLTLDAQGHSMWPLIQHGDRVIVHPLTSTPALGDIVLIDLEGRLVLHRVVALDPLTTKGDAVARPDPALASASILGRLAIGVPGFHRAVAVLSHRAGPALAFALQRLRRASVCAAEVARRTAAGRDDRGAV
jgi:hypothetical protein